MSALAALILTVSNWALVPNLAHADNLADEKKAAQYGNTDTQFLATDDETAADERIESLTKQIAKLELELIRLNTNFRIECTSVSKWKTWRFFLYNLGGSASCEAGSISIAATRWHYCNSPNPMPISSAVAGPTLLLIGHCIVLGGVLTETALDFLHDRAVRNEGFDINTTQKRVLEIKKNIDKLLAERDALLTQVPAKQGDSDSNDLSNSNLKDREVETAEGVILKDIRSLALNEYAKFFVRANRFFAVRDANSLLSASAASSGGFGGSLMGIISSARRRQRTVGIGGIGFPISGGIIVLTPILTRLVGNIRAHNASNQINSELENLESRSVLQLDADRTKLEQIISRKDPSKYSNLSNVSGRLAAYSLQSALFTAQDKIDKRELTLANKELAERMFFSTAVGGSKISWGANLANAGYGFHRRLMVQVSQGNGALKLVSSPAPGSLFTRRVAIGATSYIPSTSMWLIDTLQTRVRGELRDRALAKQNNLPAAMLKERLDRVQEIDDAFNF